MVAASMHMRRMASGGQRATHGARASPVCHLYMLPVRMTHTCRELSRARESWYWVPVPISTLCLVCPGL